MVYYCIFGEGIFVLLLLLLSSISRIIGIMEETSLSLVFNLNGIEWHLKLIQFVVCIIVVVVLAQSIQRRTTTTSGLIVDR